MPKTRLEGIVTHVHRLAVPAHCAGATDADLLERFVRHRDESAFELLVWRHGRMVHGVCRRVLGNAQDADDAFQATFLILARRAGSIGRRGSVAAWLYRVAYRAALAARARSRPHASCVTEELPDSAAADPGDVAAWREVAQLIDGLVNDLPAKYRLPILLCYVEGKSNHEAARELGCPVGTLESWLTRARARLRAGLVRHHLAVPVTLSALAKNASPPGGLVASAAAAALRFAAGRPSGCRPEATALAESVLRVSLMRKLRAGLGLSFLAGVLAAGVALAEPAARPFATQPATAEEPAADVVAGRVTDANGQPMPGAKVWLRQYADHQSRFRSTIADSQGRFRFAEVEPGYVHVAALAPGRAFAAVARVLQREQPLIDLKLVLRAPQALRLQVTEADGKPVRGAELAILNFKPEQGDWVWFPLEVLRQEKIAPEPSDEQGVLTISGVPAGYAVRAWVKHRDFARTQVTAKAGAGSVTATMRRGQALTIVAVEAATDKPAPGATVTITNTSRTADMADAPVDANGKLTVRIAAQEWVTIHVHHPELTAARFERFNDWDLKTPRTFQFLLYRKARIRGRVVEDGTSKPAPGVVVGLNAFGRTIISQAVSDDAGRYELAGPEGEATIKFLRAKDHKQAKDQEGRARAVDVRLDSSRTMEADDLVVQRVPTTRVRGTVVLPDATPVAGALVDHFEGLRTESTVADADGHFEMQVRATGRKTCRIRGTCASLHATRPSALPPWPMRNSRTCSRAGRFASGSNLSRTCAARWSGRTASPSLALRYSCEKKSARASLPSTLYSIHGGPMNTDVTSSRVCAAANDTGCRPTTRCKRKTRLTRLW
jgi:RNA polymerase sigma factor (sigma-70 family)